MDNTRFDYYVTDAGTAVTHAVSTRPINARNGFGGGLFGDYTDLAVGPDNVFHAFWTDSNNKETVARGRLRSDRGYTACTNIRGRSGFDVVDPSG